MQRDKRTILILMLCALCILILAVVDRCFQFPGEEDYTQKQASDEGFDYKLFSVDSERVTMKGSEYYWLNSEGEPAERFRFQGTQW